MVFSDKWDVRNKRQINKLFSDPVGRYDMYRTEAEGEGSDYAIKCAKTILLYLCSYYTRRGGGVLGQIRSVYPSIWKCCCRW